MTLAEVIEKMKSDPDFRKGIVMFSKDTDEGKELMNNFAQVEFDKKVGDKVFEIHKGYEDDIFEILGVRKKADQKTYDFVKELAGQLKDFKGMKPDDKDAKIKELSDKVKELNDGGEINNHWKGIYEEALSKWETREKELNDTITAKDGDFLKAQVMADLTTGRSSLKFQENLPEEVINAMVTMHEGKILAGAKLVDGKVVYHKEDGTPWMNSEIKPISAGEIWGETLGSIIQTEGQPNAGGGAPTKSGASPIVTVSSGS